MHRLLVSASAVAAFLFVAGPSASFAQEKVLLPEPGYSSPPGGYYQPIYKPFSGYSTTPLFGPVQGYGTYYGGDITYYGPSRSGLSSNSLFPAYEWGRLRKRR